MVPAKTTMVTITMPQCSKKDFGVRGCGASGLTTATGRDWSAPHKGQTVTPCSRMTRHDQQEAILFKFLRNAADATTARRQIQLEPNTCSLRAILGRPANGQGREQVGCQTQMQARCAEYEKFVRCVCSMFQSGLLFRGGPREARDGAPLRRRPLIPRQLGVATGGASWPIACNWSPQG